MKEKEYINLPAVAFPQGENNILYTFAIEGALLKEFATVTRIERKEKNVYGYQRPEVASHISDIKKYLQSDNPLLPNAIVVAFDKEVEFIPAKTTDESSTKTGILKIPIGSHVEQHKKIAWVVDGQQRMAALFEANKDNFYVCVVGFVAKDINEQREQFMLVNTTKPLSKGLLYELLPHVRCQLPTFFEKRRFPSYLLEKLNFG